jgi:hypothetical protein
LSPFRTFSPVKSVTFYRAVAGSAVALAAAAAGTLGGWPASAAAPSATGPAAGITQGAALVRHAQPASVAGRARSNSAAPAQLDAFLATSALSGRGSASERAASTPKTPEQIARAMLHRFGWGQGQFRYLNLLWSRESSWRVHAYNLYSGAYGIPQAVPGSKMSAAGPHWQTSARTQIRWGLEYISERYGSPRGAWDHELATGWY